MKKMLKEFVKELLRIYRARLPSRIFLSESISDTGVIPLKKKIEFYFSGVDVKVEKIPVNSLKPLIYHGPVLLHGPKANEIPWWHRLLRLDFDVDEKSCAMEAWHWFDARIYLEGRPDRITAKANYDLWKSELPADLDKVYLFGTGPSLANAMSRDWSDGIRIVCNTIVRDPELWHHIKPNAITAGDALYHFGYTDFACAFRRDLLKRLRESPEVVFIYPEYFHSRVVADLDIDARRLVPIETGQETAVHECVSKRFELPALGNVLNKLLLPVGCDVSRNVKLWGFDGRAPDAKLFWANSAKHAYPELMDTLQAAHPAFFDHFVPKADPEQYVRSVHGDVLEYCLSEAERAGFNIEMLHATYTPTLERRIRK